MYRSEESWKVHVRKRGMHGIYRCSLGGGDWDICISGGEGVARVMRT